MPTLEHVCKRLFSEPSWIMKCLVGALLMVVPVVHFFAFGYLYALIERARSGDSLDLPAWDDWRRLFVNGIAAFVIFVVLGLLPMALAWLVTLPLRPLGFGVLVYLPLVPAVLVAGPLTVAGIYQYQRREEYRDAFRAYVLIAMLSSTKGNFFVPTFAFIGFLVALYPLMTFALFAGLAASWTFYAASFRAIEESRKAGARVP